MTGARHHELLAELAFPQPGEAVNGYWERMNEAQGKMSAVCGYVWSKGYLAYRCKVVAKYDFSDF